jgi:hypothetical protein
MKIRKTLGVLLGAGALVFALAGTATAEVGNQTDVAWNASPSDCSGAPGGGDFTPDAGEVIWVFVHTQVDGPGVLTANFVSAGQQQADSYIQGGLKYYISTGEDTLSDFSDNLDGGVLTLSHVCYNEPTTTTTTTESSTTESSTTESSTTSFTSSEEASTTSFTSSEEAATTSLPNTATFGGNSNSNDNSWMLIATLGMLLGSALVLAPARSKSKR